LSHLAWQKFQFENTGSKNKQSLCLPIRLGLMSPLLAMGRGLRTKQKFFFNYKEGRCAMNDMLFVVFERGERGLICRTPPDNGSWIVPSRDRHQTAPVTNEVMEVMVTGQSSNGRLRFVRVLRNITEQQDRALDALREEIERSKGLLDLFKGGEVGGFTLSHSYKVEPFFSTQNWGSLFGPRRGACCSQGPR
jgi:hypothetical protein